MEQHPRQGEGCSNILDFIPKGGEWLPKRGDERSHASSDGNKLELRLGPPGDEPIRSNRGDPRKETDEPLLSLGYFSSMTHTTNRHHINGPQWPCRGYQQHLPAKVSFLQQYQTSPDASVVRESSHHCCTRVEEQNAEKKAFSPAPANTAVPNHNCTSQKRAAPAPVVGWPPIRSFRKNLASTSSGKTSLESGDRTTKIVTDEKLVGDGHKRKFVKINMDGIPIGRKIDLHAYENYEKLFVAVDQLFKGFLAAQSDPSSSGKQKDKYTRVITGFLDGKAEYTLVYDDNEGDRMLVGDVPWHMFVSAVKRLRVVKSPNLSDTNCRNQEKKVQMDCECKELG